jgi:hypothetical protein
MLGRGGNLISPIEYPPRRRPHAPSVASGPSRTSPLLPAPRRDRGRPDPQRHPARPHPAPCDTRARRSSGLCEGRAEYPMRVVGYSSRRLYSRCRVCHPLAGTPARPAAPRARRPTPNHPPSTTTTHPTLHHVKTAQAWAEDSNVEPAFTPTYARLPRGATRPPLPGPARGRYRAAIRPRRGRGRARSRTRRGLRG